MTTVPDKDSSRPSLVQTKVTLALERLGAVGEPLRVARASSVSDSVFFEGEERLKVP